MAVVFLALVTLEFRVLEYQLENLICTLLLLVSTHKGYELLSLLLFLPPSCVYIFMMCMSAVYNLACTFLLVLKVIEVDHVCVYQSFDDHFHTLVWLLAVFDLSDDQLYFSLIFMHTNICG